jgi:acetyl-CoA acetyltransferase
VDKSVVEQAVVGKLSDTGGTGQRSLYRLGFYGIPIINVANACATGSNALYLCRQMIEGGMAECALAVGVEEMAPGSLSVPGNRSLDDHMEILEGQFGIAEELPALPQLFGGAAKEHIAKYGSTPRQFAMVGEKNHRHSVNNPYSQFRDKYTLEEIENSKSVYGPITKLQCSPTSDGAAAAILCSENFVEKHGLQGQAVEIIGQAMATEVEQSLDKTLNDTSCINMVGFPMAQRAAKEVYQQTGLGPKDVQVIELHDCFSANEIFTYEALGLCAEGDGGRYVESGATTYGGSGPVCNPSGGLISKGHPIGATGVAQCCEISWQLRNECGPRQVQGAKVGMQHNLGLPGNVVVTMYKRPEKWLSHKAKCAQSGAMGFEEASSGHPLAAKL